MINLILIILGELIAYASKLLNLGHGSTWPGHIAININKNFIKEIIRANPHLKLILIAGTNGKTTTGKLIQTILENSGKKVFQNEAGANLLNGIASSIVLHSDILCKINYDYAIFEVDENTLPLILKEISPDYLVLLNLFRDQLDRYGEVNTIASKWGDSIRHLSRKTRLILNADDPQIAYLGLSNNVIPAKLVLDFDRGAGIQKNDWMPDQVGHDKDPRTILYFGLNDKKLSIKTHQHAVDSTYCPKCSSKLFYNSIYYSHLGDWECKNCKLKRPKLDISSIEHYPVLGTYNRYNTLVAVLLAKQISVEQKTIDKALHEFTPAFGRQEILNVDGKKVQIFLSKNPTSFNESLRTVAGLKAPARNATPARQSHYGSSRMADGQSVAGGKNVLFILNDRIPDGRDVSWIWDVDFEDYVDNFKTIIISGDRTYDMALRIKYTQETQNSKGKSQNHNSKFKIYEDLNEAIKNSLKALSVSETLYILPTYSAMLEVRKILTGKKIL